MGPWLLMCRPEGAAQEQFDAMQMKNTSDGEQPEVTLVPFYSPPPPGHICWGAAHGLVALKQLETEDLYLHCIVCGMRASLPPVLDGIPQGYFFNDTAFQSFCSVSGAHQHMMVNHVLHYEQLDLELADANEWKACLGTTTYTIKSVVFKDGHRMFGVTANNTVVVSEYRGSRVTLLPIPMDEELETSSWMRNGQHMFKCSDKVYVCVLVRVLNDVKAIVFQVDHDPTTGYHLVRVSDIGSYAVFLASNQAFTLRVVDGSSSQRRNTLYIPDDDGTTRKSRILSIDISSNVVSLLPFPPGININNYSHAVWVAAAKPGGPMIHCNH